MKEVFVAEVGTRNELNRENFLREALQNIPTNARILDAGAGELKYKPFCAHLNYVSQDFAKYDGKGNDAGLQMGAWDQTKLDIVSDITEIPEPDDSFDAIMCVEVLEHLPKPDLAIKEFSRLLHKGGALIITAPFCSLTHFAPYHFHTGFNKYFYETLLKEYGFEIVKIETNGNYFEYLAQEVRRVPYCAQTYANTALTAEGTNILSNMLILLEELNKLNNNSEEFLCFGYHVVAKKI